MFLVSNEDLVVESCEAGVLGSFPALNYRPIENYKKALKEIRSRTSRPFGVNIIVNKSNLRQKEDLKFALDSGASLFITSLGNPKEVIKEAHQNGAKVYCDVTNIEFAKKVEDLGADGLIAVGQGAGGHAGPVSPLVLVPWLKKNTELPVILAGGIATGEQIVAALALGASGVSVGTRFIASQEATVSKDYKEAVVSASPEDILLTKWISGTPASVIRTPYTQKLEKDLPFLVQFLKKNPWTKPLTTMVIHWSGMRSLQKAAEGASWKTVWSAGQSAGLVNEVLSVQEIVDRLEHEIHESLKKFE